MTIPNSTTRFVEASRNAKDGINPAPLANRDRVAARAANEQELEMNPKKVPRNTLPAPASPMLLRMRSRVTKT